MLNAVGFDIFRLGGDALEIDVLLDKSFSMFISYRHHLPVRISEEKLHFYLEGWLIGFKNQIFSLLIKGSRCYLANLNCTRRIYFFWKADWSFAFLTCNTFSADAIYLKYLLVTWLPADIIVAEALN